MPLKKSTHRINSYGAIQVMNKCSALLRTFLPFVGLAFVVILFAILTKGRLLNKTNLSNIISQCFTTVIVSVGMAFVYAFGGFDLSLGAVSGITQLVGASIVLSIENSLPPALLLLIMVLFCTTVLMLNGVVQVITKVDPFIVTLCMKFICSGILTSVTAKGYLTVEYSYFQRYLSSGSMMLTLILVIAVGYFLFEFTSIGKSLRLIGGSRTVARQSGFQNGKIIITAYALGGACLGIASFFLLGKVGIVQPSTGSGIEFNSLIAIVLGGMPLTGGANARMHNALLGAVTISFLINGLTLVGVDVGLINGIKGLLFIIIVGLSYVRGPGKIVL